MVAMMHILVLLFSIQQSPSTYEKLFPRTPPPRIARVLTISQSEGEIKPCQAFTVVFDVTLAGEALRTQWPKIARTASRLVRVNGNDHRNKLSGGSTNGACVFKLLWPSPIGRKPPLQSSDSALIMATCQIDLEQRACLFHEPGDYHLEFFFEDQKVEAFVHTNAPTPAERQIIDRLNTLPMFFLLLDPTDWQYATPKNIQTLEGLLAIESDYSDMLAMTAGVAKGLRVGRPLWNELTDEQKRGELEERKKLLEPVVSREQLVTQLEGRAAYELAKVATQLEHLVVDPPQREAYRNLQSQQLRKVAECRIVPRQQALAKEMVKARALQKK